MNQPGEDVLDSFSQQLGRVLCEAAKDGNLDFEPLVRALIVKALQDGLIEYCPAWEMRVEAGSARIFLDWTINWGSDWEKLYKITVH